VQANLHAQVKAFGRPELPLGTDSLDADKPKLVGGPEVHALRDDWIALRRDGHNPIPSNVATIGNRATKSGITIWRRGRDSNVMIRPKRTAYLATFSRKSEEKYSNFKIIIQASDVAASSGIFYLQKLRKNSLLLPGTNPFVAIPNLNSSAVALHASQGTQVRSPGVGNNSQPG
jgi:hypothetical protein